MNESESERKKALDKAMRRGFLMAAIRRGAALYDFIRAQQEVQPPSAWERELFEKAVDQWHEEGVVEIDSDTTASFDPAEENPSGAYVLAWVWVEHPKQSVKKEEDDHE